MSKSPEPVVLLVDNKTRDLPATSLIAHHMRAAGVECYLEPLEAFRGVLSAYRPGMIIFNHLFTSGLAEWSRYLNEMGVLTAVLSNEGMFLREDDLKFNAGRFHKDGHVDYFFCWNRVHRDELRRSNVYPEAKIEVVGVPRFDFYFEPWSRLIAPATSSKSSRPHILACTNFGIAKFRDLPPEHGDRFFAGWTKLPLYKDYRSAIESNWRSQRGFLKYIMPLIDSGKYDITLRPHPAELHSFYENWLTTLTSEQRSRLRYDPSGNISTLIFDCDLEISGESCTTAVESWIIGKPTLELVFEKHPMIYAEERSSGNVHCENPAQILAQVDEQLANPSQSQLKTIRADYLEKWCATPDGNACRRVAEISAAAVKSKQPADWSKLRSVDYRRGLKLQATRMIGEAYHYSPLLPIKNMFAPKRYAIRKFGYDKAIKPKDVAAARKKIEQSITDKRS